MCFELKKEKKLEILPFYKWKDNTKISILPKCCDVCSMQCDCEVCPEMFKICANLSNCPCTLERQVYMDERGPCHA